MHNRIEIIGNVGKEPEMRFTPSGKPVTSFSVATTSYKTVEGERKQETEWFGVSTWEKQAEACNQFVTKGMKVHVTGSVHLRKWEGGSVMEIKNARVLFLDKREAKPEVEPEEVF